MVSARQWVQLAAIVVVALLAGGASAAAADAAPLMPPSLLGARALPTGAGGGASGSQVNLAQAYGRLPLAFEANRGQTDSRVRFLARTPGATVFLTRRGAVLSLPRHGPEGKHAALSLRFAGSNPRPQMAGRSRLPGTVNYLRGNDRLHGIPTYAQVAYRHVWEGIDAVFYGHRGRLEYDFDVAPGADPDRIVLDVDGARSLHVTQGGALAMRVAGTTVRQLAPHAYQQINGTRRPVTAHWVLSGQSAHLRVGHYDHGRPLVIDPALAYSARLGGSRDDHGFGIAVDSRGAAYVTGTTASRDFPTRHAVQSRFRGGHKLPHTVAYVKDAFVLKLSPDGRRVEYATYLGGSGYDCGFGIAVDSHGDAYVTGQTTSRDFPTRHALQSHRGGHSDAFIAELSPSGSKLKYSTYLGGSHLDEGYGIVLDARGDAYLTGETRSRDFPTRYPLQQKAGGGTGRNADDAFIAELGPSGRKLKYSTYLGGSSKDRGVAIALDTHGDAYITGETTSSDFPTKNAFQATFRNGDAFVAELGAGGPSLKYSTYLGGRGRDRGFGIAVNSQGAAYITGVTQSNDFPTVHAEQPNYVGNGTEADTETFVTKFSPDGRSLEYSTFLRGGGKAIAVDGRGDAYVTGQRVTDQGGPVIELSSDGRLVYSTHLPSDDTSSEGIAVDGRGAAYVTGWTFYARTGISNDDLFVVKVTPAGTPPSAVICHGRAATVMGTEADETIHGTSGDDVIVGLGGDDTIEGRGGDDVICGGDGNDHLLGNGGHDRLFGGVGADRLTGGHAGDVLVGNRGRDILAGGPGHDRLHGERGHDWLRGNRGHDRLSGGPAGDVLSGGPAGDRLAGGHGSDRLAGGRGPDRLSGGAGHDRLRGGTGHDQLSGSSAGDRLWGGPAGDHLMGNHGGDVLWGNLGGDELRGGPGHDTLHGGPGQDHLAGGRAGDVCSGGHGHNSVSAC